MGEDADRVAEIAAEGLVWNTDLGATRVAIMGSDGRLAHVQLPESPMNQLLDRETFRPVTLLGDLMQARVVGLVGPILLGRLDEDGAVIPAEHDPAAHRAALSWAGSSTGDEAIYISVAHRLDDGSEVFDEPVPWGGPVLNGPLHDLRDMVTGVPMGGLAVFRRACARLMVGVLRRRGYHVETRRR